MIFCVIFEKGMVDFLAIYVSQVQYSREYIYPTDAMVNKFTFITNSLVKWIRSLICLLFGWVVDE